MTGRTGLWTLLSFVCLFVLFVFARVNGGFLPWFLLYFALLFLAFEWGTRLLALRKTRMTRTLSAVRLEAGETLQVDVTVTRARRWPIAWAKLDMDLPARLRLNAHGLGRVLVPMWQRRFRVRCEIVNVPRGVYRIGSVSVETGDPFGVVRLKAEQRLHDTVLVFPRTVPVRGWSGTRPEEYGQRQPTRRRAEESSNVLGVRDYVKGDRLSRIHWPATARTGLLKAKEFELHVTSEMLFIADASDSSFAANEFGGSALFELQMVITASLIKYAHEQHRRYAAAFHVNRLITFGPGTGSALFMRCMETLAELGPTAPVPFPKSIARISQEASAGSVFVVISPRLDRDLAAALSVARTRGRVEWFIPVTGALSESARETLELVQRMGISSYLINSPEQLSNLTRGGVYRATGV